MQSPALCYIKYVARNAIDVCYFQSSGGVLSRQNNVGAPGAPKTKDQAKSLQDKRAWLQRVPTQAYVILPSCH